MRYLFILLIALHSIPARAGDTDAARAYQHFFRQKECNPVAFALAWRGYRIMLRGNLLQTPQYLTIIDYTKPSNSKRLFVLDVPSRRLVLSSIVAHGLGSDPDSSTIPHRFSNRDDSRMSSLGFYLTGEIYTNFRPGDSLGLCLFGLDKGYNDSAAAREIVLHYGATEYSGRVYVTDSGAARSYGCPALPLSTNSRVISLIKGGSLLFIYSGKSPEYLQHSTVLGNRIRLPLLQQGPPPNNCSCNLQRPRVR